MVKKPNIVFVHVDQLKQSALGAFGCDQAKTPNLDRLIRDSVVFEKSYSAVPICIPARTCWYTGLEPEQSGISNNGMWIENPETVTDLGTWLRDKGGYDCFYIGKWHVALKEKQCGFRQLHGSNSIGEYGDTALARAAEDFLLNRKGEKPFFLNVSLLNPHDICYWSFEYSPAKFSMAKEMESQLPPLPPNFDRTLKAEVEWTDLQWRFYAYTYFRLVEMVDEEIGRVYRAFRRSPQRDNTVFIFSSDHGQASGEHGYLTKNTPYEHSLRVPLAVVDPRAAPRRDRAHLVSGLDLAPTVCDYAGVELMPRNNGKSFKTLVHNEKAEWRDWLAVTTPRFRHRVVLKDDHKLIYTRQTGEASLFNLANDPYEMKNLFNDPACRAVRDELMAIRTDYDAVRPLPSAAKSGGDAGE